MVASITSLGKYSDRDGKPFDGEYFMGLINPNYWTEGGEAPGRWFGGATVKLGLTGEVKREALQHLLKGHDSSGKSLLLQKKTRRMRIGHTPSRHAYCPGFDLTFSSPKSLAAFWAIADPDLRRQITEAIDRAITTVLTWFENNVPLARRGRGGNQKEFAKLVIAMFDHSVSRVTDTGRFEPQPHRHCLIMNVAEREDGSYGAINSPLLHQWVRTLGPMFRATVAKELRESCGFQFYRPLDRKDQPQGWFEIKGVPVALCQHWSSRKNEMDALLETSINGVKLGREQSTGQAREKANLKTRRAKRKLPPLSELTVEWRQTAKEFGFTEAAARKLRRKQRTISAEKIFEKVWREAEEKLTRSQSHFTYREAVQRVCEAAQDQGVSGVYLADRTKSYLEQSHEIVPLGEYRKEMQYTTQTVWRLEQKFLAEVKELRESRGAIVAEQEIDRAIHQKPTIEPDQAEAVRHLLRSDSRLRVMTGVAGAGKSFTLDAVREGLEQSGYRVLGGALAAVAKEELAEKTGIESRTVASYLYQLDKSTGQEVQSQARHAARQIVRALQGKKTFSHSPFKLNARDVLVIDEAGMLDTRTLSRLCQAVRKAGATLILVGDPQQLQPIDAGAPLAHLQRKLSSAHLTTNMRQKDPHDKAASMAIREGRTEEAIQSFRERGRLVVKNDKRATIHQLINDWARQGGMKRPTDHVIFTQTRDEARAVNRLCQAKRIEHGLSHSAKHVRVGNEKICQGDRILFHQARFADGIANGYRGTVVGTNAMFGRLTIELDGQESRKVTVRIADYGRDGISLGYAQTTHKGQGQSVEHAYLLFGSSMTDREMSYVQGTRGKLSTTLYVDELHAGRELKDLARSMNRSRAKLMAHDIPGRDSIATDQVHSLERRLER